MDILVHRAQGKTRHRIRHDARGQRASEIPVFHTKHIHRRITEQQCDTYRYHMPRLWMIMSTQRLRIVDEECTQRMHVDVVQ